MQHSNKPPINFNYDQGSNGTGRLTQMTDESGTTRWTYNLQGRVASKTFNTGSLTLVTKYSYNTNGQLTALYLPIRQSRATDLQQRPNKRSGRQPFAAA
ncbi:MAG: hypothetical protein PHF31_12030 [Methylobacter sp.]|nr:hypothetical protein [Methylobacter sp.]